MKRLIEKIWKKSVPACIFLVVFSLVGCGGGGDGGSSPGVPSAPTGVTAVAGDNSASIGWDNVAGATSYNIYYSTTTGVPKATATKIAGVTSPNIITGLNNGTPYFFVVTAVNAIGESVDSSQISATPTAAPPPPAPTNVTATAGPGQATIAWTNSTGATSYNIYYSTTTGVTKATGTKITGVPSPHIVTGLANGTPYYFVVTAVNANGESADSSQVSATPTAAPAPPAPTNVTATPGPGQVTVAWDNSTGATSYNIYYSTTTGVTKTTGTKIAGVTNPRAVTGLIRGTPYYFVVTALNSDNVESTDSTQASAAPNSPNPNYSQSDLTGIWNVRGILTGTSSGWYGVTATVDNTGNVSLSDPVGSAAPPALSAFSITSGTGASAGVVTETGVGSNATFFGKMSTGKTLIVGTSTRPDGTTLALHVFVKRVPGVTFSSTDLANTTIAYQKIESGNSNFWERGNGSINGSGLMTITSVEGSGGPVVPGATNISVNSTTGIVSIVAEPSFSGIMAPDKKIIVGASTDGAGIYSLRIIQMRGGQTYTQADLVGEYQAFAFISRDTPLWAHAIWSTNNAGDVTFVQFLDSTGATALPDPFSTILDAQGNVAGGGMLSFGKDLLVSTGDATAGSFIEIKVQ